MIVYVESNFVLELAFLQEGHEDCDAILKLGESGVIRLIVPGFSLIEPYETLVRRSRRRAELSRRLSEESRELSRSRPYSEITEMAGEIASILISIGEEEKQRPDSTLLRILDASEMIPIQPNTLKRALGIQTELSLSPQDSIVFTSVIQHLELGNLDHKCFLNKDSKDFLNPDIEGRLDRHDCRLITSFAQGLQYINSANN